MSDVLILLYCYSKIRGDSIRTIDIVNKLFNEFSHNPVYWSCGLSHKGKKRLGCDCQAAIQHVLELCIQCGLSHPGQSEICVQCLSKPKLWQCMVAPLRDLQILNSSNTLSSLLLFLYENISTLNSAYVFFMPYDLRDTQRNFAELTGIQARNFNGSCTYYLNSGEENSIRTIDIVNKLFNEFLHNPVCWSCGLSHKGKKLVCCDCEAAIQHVLEPCIQCGLSHPGQNEICVQCLSNPKIWQCMVAPLSYKQPVSRSIQLLKYNQKLEVLKALLELAIPKFRAISVKPDLLIPVPLHKNRYIERGFNQSYEIARLLAKALNIACSDRYVQRVIETPRQSGLKLKQREKNVKNAFKADARLSQYQHVIIIDDVVTSGSTVHELSKQCLRVGVARVDVWALARTELA